MRIEYELKHDIVNIQFLENVDIEESVELDGVIIDYAKDKRIVSIEILDVGKRMEKNSGRNRLRSNKRKGGGINH